MDFSKYDEAFAKALATAKTLAPSSIWSAEYEKHLKSFFDQWPAERSVEAAHNHAAARSEKKDFETCSADEPQTASVLEFVRTTYAQLKKVVDDTPAPLPYRDDVDIEDTALAPNVGPLDVVSYAAAAPTIEAAPVAPVPGFDPVPADGVLDPNGLPPNDVAPPVKASKRA